MSESVWSLREGIVDFEFPDYGLGAKDTALFIENVESVIPRLGAKTKLREWLVQRFPKCHCYVEPFGGSFKVLLWKRKADPVEVINDFDGDLVHFFRYCTYFPDVLAKEINRLPCHQGVISALRGELATGSLSNMERAIAFYVSARSSFNGTGSGWAGDPRTKVRIKADARKFRAVSDRLRDVDIRTGNAFDVIASCNKTLKSSYGGNVFFYLDPPYDETAGYKTASGSIGFGRAEQVQLLNQCKKIDAAGNTFIQTNSYTPWIRDSYSRAGFYVGTRQVSYQVSGKAEARKDHTEAIISNMDLDNVRKQKTHGSLFS